MVDENEVRQIVRQVVERTLNPNSPPSVAPQAASSPSSAVTRGRALVTERDIMAVPRGAEFHIPPGSILTPLAKEQVMARSIRVLDGEAGANPSSSAESASLSKGGQAVASAPAKTVAIGSDHGGFELKQDLVTYLGELGYAAVDCGTHGPESVDYPDYAYAVAKLVADGRAAQGIVVDGVGIGSCMAANKVPGVRAAMCYDISTARNSREHNDANVLTLGGRMIGSVLAHQIVETWLGTSFPGGRHKRRVDKIVDIEKRFSKAG